MSWANAIVKRADSQTVRKPLSKTKRDLSRLVTVDIETYYDAQYSLKNPAYNTSEYIRDPQFKVHMVGVKIGRGRTRVFNEAQSKIELNKIDWSTHQLLCHNTAFDGLILSHHYGIKPHYVYDTLSMARALLSHEVRGKLDDVARHFGVGNKLPDVLDQAKGVRDLPKALYKQLAAYCAVDVDLCFNVFLRMLPDMPEHELDLVDLIIRMFTDPVLRIDLKRAKKLVEEEQIHNKKLLLNVAPTEDEARTILRSNPKFAALLESLGVEPPKKISKTTLQPTFAFAKTDEDFQALAQHPSAKIRGLVAARFAAKSTINETRALRLIKAGETGALPVMYNCFAARTHRTSGGNKLNLQNLPRGGELRRSIIAPSGYEVIAADSGQIEARVLAWLAGQLDLLQAFAAQSDDSPIDAYTSLASEFYGREITKKDKTERFIGKVGRLGLGYGMAALRLQATLAMGVMGPPVHLSLEECQRLVNVYRSRSRMICALWRRMDSIIADMMVGRSGEYKCLSWEKDKLWLPSGLCLKYPGLRAQYCEDIGRYDSFSYLSRGERISLFGMKLTENVVQALARIVITEQMLKIAKAGWRVVMFTHDENVMVAKKKDVKRCIEDVTRIMKEPCYWCLDLPLSVEVQHGKEYPK